MKKKRRLKKKVKVGLVTILLLIIIIVGLFFYKNNIDNTKNNKPKVVEKKKVKKNESNKKEKKEEPKEELERFTYKEGFYSEKLSSEIKEKITGHSYPAEFSPEYTAVSYDDFRYLKMKYYDFSEKEHTDGEMIVHKDLANETLEIFYELYQNKYPIAKMVLVEEYDADDELSMRDNNTSAFNYRITEQSDTLSLHCFGVAIDINPLFNPYILGNTIYPSTAGDYVDRDRDFPGKIDYDDLAYKLFTDHGWKWGGDFYGCSDYQHFYRDDIIDRSLRERRAN